MDIDILTYEQYIDKVGSKSSGGDDGGGLRGGLKAGPNPDDTKLSSIIEDCVVFLYGDNPGGNMGFPPNGGLILFIIGGYLVGMQFNYGYLDSLLASNLMYAYSQDKLNWTEDEMYAFMNGGELPINKTTGQVKPMFKSGYDEGYRLQLRTMYSNVDEQTGDSVLDLSQWPEEDAHVGALGDYNAGGDSGGGGPIK